MVCAMEGHLEARFHDQGFAEALEGIVLAVVLHQEHLPKCTRSQCRYLLQLFQLNHLHIKPTNYAGTVSR